MNSFSVGGFEPFRRLTQLYTDTKKSYEFTAPPTISEAPELSILHRKLRIQRNRLTAWGLQWSDYGAAQPADIDESIDKAGLSDVVGSVLSTINEIITEADPLWQASRRYTEVQSSDKLIDRKQPIIAWNKARFEELVGELTTSIDILYDVSRERQSARPLASSREDDSEKQFSRASSQSRPFESTRLRTPRLIDASDLIHPGCLTAEFLHAGALGIEPDPRSNESQIIYMRTQHIANNPWKTSGGIMVKPVFIDFAPFDEMFGSTGIPPPMDRFEKLFAGLNAPGHIHIDRNLRVANLLGYIEDTERDRFGLVYELPSQFGSVDAESQGNSSLPSRTTVSEMLYSRAVGPPLESRLHLSRAIAETVYKLLAKEIIHGDISSSNMSFFHSRELNPVSDGLWESLDFGQPFLTSFDLFSDDDKLISDSQSAVKGLIGDFGDDMPKDNNRSWDLRSLALLLLEIGLWQPLGDIDFGDPDPRDPRFTNSFAFKHLAMKCGTLYTRAVVMCWEAADAQADMRSDIATSTRKAKALHGKAVKALSRCCTIDEYFDEAEILVDLESPVPAIRTNSTPMFGKTNWAVESETSRERSGLRSSSSSKPSELALAEKSVPIERTLATTTSTEKAIAIPIGPEPTIRPKLKLYSSILLSQDKLDEWHTRLMPGINRALSGFYRNHPESVEISLETVGLSKQKAKPTICVICTSVGKVKSILKRHFTYNTAVYDLKVCRGKVVRSRKNHAPLHASSSSLDISNNEDHIKPLNPFHQDRPVNGASIGAFADGKHLPPVSFGGIVQIEDEIFGMTVHHMLQDLSDEEVIDTTPSIEEPEPLKTLDELAEAYAIPYADSDTESAYELSDFDSDSEFEGSDYDEENDAPDFVLSHLADEGDVRGVAPGEGEKYIITQPALDDAEDYRVIAPGTHKDNHLHVNSFGRVYASSGIRRRWTYGVAHEVDWALFKIEPKRMPPRNVISNGDSFCDSKDPYPQRISPWSELPNLGVHCMGRTSGLRSGRISQRMSSVKLYGRQSPADSYEVFGGIGVPGDSGAWIVDNVEGRACGHVLAWSERKQLAYMCPMEVLFEDIADTLDVENVCLPILSTSMYSEAGDEGYSSSDVASSVSSHNGFQGIKEAIPLRSKSPATMDAKSKFSVGLATVSASDFESPTTAANVHDIS